MRLHSNRNHRSCSSCWAYSLKLCHRANDSPYPTYKIQPENEPTSGSNYISFSPFHVVIEHPSTLLNFTFSSLIDRDSRTFFSPQPIPEKRGPPSTHLLAQPITNIPHGLVPARDAVTWQDTISIPTKSLIGA